MNVMKRFYPKLGRKQILQYDSVLEAFFSSAERGREVLNAITDEEYSDQ